MVATYTNFLGDMCNVQRHGNYRQWAGALLEVLHTSEVFSRDQKLPTSGRQKLDSRPGQERDSIL
jgi:hypothetical protein